MADTARFDLIGPKVDVRVTREGKSLPIATVPNLLEADHLWLHADLPETQSVKYLLVVVFLRGTTNPPPEDWIVKIQTWDKKIKAEGAEVVVPPGAQQVLLLLAPETGGDISALRSFVPGPASLFERPRTLMKQALNRHVLKNTSMKCARFLQTIRRQLPSTPIFWLEP